MAVKKRGLGRGLDALLGGSMAKAVEAPQGADLREVPVDLLRPGKYQPRTDMHPESLEELANSIKAQGVVQPIVIRPIAEQLFAGRAPWRSHYEKFQIEPQST